MKAISADQVRSRVQIIAVMIEAALPGWYFELRVKDAPAPMTEEIITITHEPTHEG